MNVVGRWSGFFTETEVDLKLAALLLRVWHISRKFPSFIFILCTFTAIVHKRVRNWFEHELRIFVRKGLQDPQGCQTSSVCILFIATQHFQRLLETFNLHALASNFGLFVCYSGLFIRILCLFVCNVCLTLSGLRLNVSKIRTQSRKN